MYYLLMLSILLISYNANATGTSEFGPKEFTVKNKWTAIVAAFAPEMKAINQAFEHLPDAHIEQTLVIKGVEYQIGRYKSEPVVIFTTGVSVSNAAMTMQMALDYFPIERVVMMGIAGAVNPEFQVGDIAVPERWYFHDESLYANPDPKKAGDFVLTDHYKVALKTYQQRTHQDPHLPNYENFGFVHPREISIVKQGWDKPRNMPYFTATPKLIELAHNAVKSVPHILMPSGKAIQIRVGGNGVTGSVFLDNAEYRLWLQQVYQADVAEMESAAVGQVCFINNIDWVIIRSISDLAGGQKGKNTESVFDGIASGTGTKFLIGLLNEIVDMEKVSH